MWRASLPTWRKYEVVCQKYACSTPAVCCCNDWTVRGLRFNKASWCSISRSSWPRWSSGSCWTSRTRWPCWSRWSRWTSRTCRPPWASYGVCQYQLVLRFVHGYVYRHRGSARRNLPRLGELLILLSGAYCGYHSDLRWIRRFKHVVFQSRGFGTTRREWRITELGLRN